MATVPPTSPDDAAPTKRNRPKLSCLGKSLVGFIDGGAFGAAIGGIMSAAQGVSSVMAGSESLFGAVQTVARATGRSGLSLGAALAGYQGGVCTLEAARGRRDFINPFIVGGLGGLVSAIQVVDVHDGQTKRRAFAYNPRAALIGGLSSAGLCSAFWWMQQPSRAARERREQEEVEAVQRALAAAEEQTSRERLREQQQRQRAALGTPLATPLPPLAPAAPAGDASATGALHGELLLSDGSDSQQQPGFDGAPPPPPPDEFQQQQLVEPTTTPELAEAPAFAADGSFSDPWAKGKSQ